MFLSTDVDSYFHIGNILFHFLALLLLDMTSGGICLNLIYAWRVHNQFVIITWVPRQVSAATTRLETKFLLGVFTIGIGISSL